MRNGGRRGGGFYGYSEASVSVVASNPFRFRDQLDFASNDSLHAAAQWITEAPCAQFACHMLLPQPAQLSLRHGLAVCLAFFDLYLHVNGA